MDQLPRLGKRELICWLLFTCNYVVSVWRGFLFLWVLGMGYVILLWHSLSLPYNYFEGGIVVLTVSAPDLYFFYLARHCLNYQVLMYMTSPAKTNEGTCRRVLVFIFFFVFLTLDYFAFLLLYLI